ncbi:MAG: acyl-CoA dehydrogenase [Actinomycetota bacterium]
MRALFGESELLLQETVRAIAADLIPDTVGGLEDFDDAPLWEAVARGGLIGLGVPATAGGSGSVVDMSIVVRELARRTAPVPLVGATVAAHLIAGSGADASDLILGRERAGIGLTADLSGLGSAIGFDTAGSPHAAAIGDSAVERLELSDALDPFDLTREMASLVAGGGERLGSLDHSAARTRVDAVALIAVAADALGAMTGALEIAIGHAATREQFGQPIGRFQAVQHLLSDAHVDVEGARALVDHAAWSVDHEPAAVALRAARIAKAYTAEHGKAVCERVVQVFGGMGMTWECRAHVFQRRVMADRVVLGDERHHYRLLAEEAT